MGEKSLLRAVCFLWIAFLILFAACAGQGTPFEREPPSPKPEDPNATPLPRGTEGPPLNPYAPGKGDEALQRGELLIDSQKIWVLESFPPQFQLEVKGFLPTRCHDLRAVIDEPNGQSQIHVHMFSVFDPEAVCTQVSKPFEARIPLGGYASGSYTVFVNGKEAGEIIL